MTEPTALLSLTVAARVAEQLRSEIRDGVLGAGTPLRQNEVAARLGVSSTPVREAFQMLERLGLVQREGRRGVRVFRPSIQDLLDSYEVRAILEAEAVRRSVGRWGADHLAQLGTVLQRMSEPALEREQFLRLNIEFHHRIAAAAGNPRLCELIDSEQAATTTYVTFLGVEPDSSNQAHVEHAAIFDAIRAGDAEQAARAMTAHLTIRAHALQARLGAKATGTRASA